jgi:hypothetical protein
MRTRAAIPADRGFGPDEESEADLDDGQELLQAASLAGREGLGRRAGRRTRRVVLLGGREVRLPPLCSAYEGYNLHAGVFVGAAYVWRGTSAGRPCRRHGWSVGRTGL